ncbi:conserved hypothetical protein [Leishmania braziliensis MHOM/BR/75/M2904]|uniref:Uncharacterized protein n=2 Tax=Leishmania braziliensis TaxID=5660 RepID=A4HJ26_LEIBR|nr:conserved hypothetical protein [Leishmania braziliensis MHOM/BR/75/M2904]CAJ2477706.1 unnamed protein product [Leishmania braziliensis]CAM42484.2 conserved hypothetical protein [Leishmania braziliensis MHOM/BR/75/M2904]SYZ68245.1 hypothetical_protein [Leishmania braziliensis MHOM/BR/75/M2904]
MLRCTSLAHLRVLCLTMLPDGGALTPALRKLGYTPYTLRSTYQQGHASTHPIAWSRLLDGKTSALPAKVLADYDAVVGPPGAMVYDVLLGQAPSYTKIILVEETEKDKWAEEYEAYLERLQISTKRASQNRITKAFQLMIAKMVVGGDASGAAMDAPVGAASSLSTRESRGCMISSSGALRRSFAAEATELKRGFCGSKGLSATPVNDLSDDSRGTATAERERQEETNNANDGQLRHPRAVALQLYEESVKMSIPRSALLVYRYGDGWEPLCSFLDKPIPSAPFPEYDDGLRVLGNLQERIDRAHALQYLVGGVCVVCALVTVLPRCEGIVRFVKDLYADYQVAFGPDSAASARKTVGGGSLQTDAEKFEAAWQKRGGAVTLTTNECRSLAKSPL